MLSFLFLLVFHVGISFTPDETVCIMTRDNVCLSTDVYFPQTGNKPYSCVYRTTPYDKSTLDPTQWTDAGFCYLAQDFRGMGQSNGTYSTWRTNGNDTVDTIKWLLQTEQRKFSDGFLGVTGVSADAAAQYTGMSGITQSKSNDNFNQNNELMNHIKVAFLIVGVSTTRQVFYQNGAFRAGLVDGYFKDINEQQSIVEILENEPFYAWWYPIAGNWTNWDVENHPNEAELSLFNHSMVHLAGWYDILSINQIRTAMSINETAQIGAKGQQILIVEPTGHCDGGAIKWPNASYGNDLMDSMLGVQIFNGAFEAAKKNKFFNIHDFVAWNVLFYMLGPGERDSNGLFWIAAESFPPTLPVYAYLNGDNSLDTNVPETSGSLSYLFDPTDPVQTYGGNNLELSPCGPQSQEKNEKGRNDILHFISDVLDDDLALVGLITVQLFVSSDAVDTDFTAKLIDIFPNGTPMLVQDGILRMRWRNGPYQTFVAPEMKKGQVYEIVVEIGWMAYIFNSGHQISLSISSSNSARFSVNYNNGNFVIKGGIDPVTANNTIYFGKKYPSRLVLPVVDMVWINHRKVDM